MTAPAPRPRTGSLGCLGAFSILALTFFTLLELGLAWRLNASWFDRVAFWRAPRVSPEPVFVTDAEADAIQKQWRDETPANPPPRRKPAPTRPGLMKDAAVTADYSPASAATLTDPRNGATVHIPAGALGRPAKVTLTPADRVPASMVAPFAGPVVDLRFDDREHTTFSHPIEISLPYVRGSVPDDQVAVRVWENDRWVALPSRVDAARGMVTATSPHASLFGVVAAATGLSTTAVGGLILLGGLLVGGENDTARAGAYAVLYGLSDEYETPEGNFKVHFYRSGPSRVPKDWELLNDPNSPEGSTPLYVRRIGHWLEYARKELHAEGFALPPSKLIRYDCFLVPCGDGESKMDLGESLFGGPLCISPRLLKIAKDDGTDLEGLMKSTCVHELLHVAQGAHYGMFKSKMPWMNLQPFCEADAEYNSWRFWRKRGMDDAYHFRTYIAPNPQLTKTPFDKTEDPTWYSYSLWFEWMQHRFGESAPMEFLLETHKAGNGSLAAMDGAARKMLGRRGIPDLGAAMAEFAVDYYYQDFWSLKVAPQAFPNRNAAQTAQAYSDGDFAASTPIRNFLWLAGPLQNRILRTEFDERRRPGIPHLTASALYVATLPVVESPDAPRPKLVIEAEGAALPQLQVSVGAGTMANPFGMPPFGGSPGPLKGLSTLGGRGQTIVEGFGARGGPNFVAILIVNRSLDTDAGALTVRRWLLEPPPFAQLEAPAKPGATWILKWRPALLEPHREAFGNYRVYRRPFRNSRESKEFVMEVKSVSGGSEFVRTELTGDDVADHIYSLAVLDSRGNESDRRDAEMNDPFIGTWEGQITLVQGSFAQPILAAIKKSSDEADAREIARIAGLPDPAQRARAQQTWQENVQVREKLVAVLKELLSGAEQAARMGVPLQFKVRLVEGRYMVGLSEIVWGLVPLEPQMQAEFELKRVDRLSLSVPDLPPELPPIKLMLTRLDPEGKKPNVIREDNYVLETKGEAAQTVPIRCVIRWDFERVSREAPAPK